MKRARRTLGSSGLKGHAEPSQRKKSRKKTNELKKILIPQRGEGQDTGRRFVLLHRDVSHHEDENRKVKISFTFFLFSCFLFSDATQRDVSDHEHENRKMIISSGRTRFNYSTITMRSCLTTYQSTYFLLIRRDGFH